MYFFIKNRNEFKFKIHNTNKLKSIILQCSYESYKVWYDDSL